MFLLNLSALSFHVSWYKDNFLRCCLKWPVSFIYNQTSLKDGRNVVNLIKWDFKDQHQRLCELIKRFWHKTQCCKYSAQFNKEYIYFFVLSLHTPLFPNLTHRTIYMYWPLCWCLCCILKSWKWALILTTKFTWVCTIYEAATNSCGAYGNIREVRRSSEAETRLQLVHFPLHFLRVRGQR